MLVIRSEGIIASSVTPRKVWMSRSKMRDTRVWAGMERSLFRRSEGDRDVGMEKVESTFWS